MRPDRRIWRGACALGLAGCLADAEGFTEVEGWSCPDAASPLAFETLSVPTDPATSHRFAGAGLGIGDLDRDGRPDLVAPGPRRLQIFWQEGPLERPRFRAAEVPEGVADLGADATAVALADVDGDGDLDVYVARFGPPDQLLVNDGAGGLAPRDDPTIQIPHYAQGAAFAHLDDDGRLDIVVAGHGPVEAADGRTAIDGPADPTRLLYQLDDGSFEDRSAEIDEGAHDAYTFVATPAHLDDDGRLDVLLANDFPVYRPNQALLRTDEGFARSPGTGLHVRAAGMGVAAHDVNGDGWEDFVLPVWNRLVFLQSVDGRPPRWVEAQSARGLEIGRPEPAWVGWGADFGDLDADGRADLVVAFGHLDTVGVLTAGGTSADNALDQPDRAFRATASGFAPADWGLEHPGVSRGLLLVDVNRDGRLDVVRRDLRGEVRVDVARCSSGDTLVVELTPLDAAIGAAVAVELTDGRSVARTVRAGGTSLGSAGPPEAHFGVGELDVRRIEVRWPDGAVTRHRKPRTNHRFRARHPSR